LGDMLSPTRRMLDLFHEILEYNDGKRVTHKVGRFVNDRYAHRNRWVRAMRQTDIPMRLIDGPVDPNSGRHMAQRYLEVIPNPDVVMLNDTIGHWPQIEAPDAVLKNFLAHVDRVTAEQ
jgi:pimeloyl-ACP methyl ester carboxylesterase